MTSKAVSLFKDPITGGRRHGFTHQQKARSTVTECIFHLSSLVLWVENSSSTGGGVLLLSLRCPALLQLHFVISARPFSFNPKPLASGLFLPLPVTSSNSHHKDDDNPN